MTFLTRVDDQIDIAGFTRISEKAIWQAIENAGLANEGWTVCKESNGLPALHLYIEPKESENGTLAEMTNRIHEELKKLDTPYAELESFTGLKPLVVTQLPHNTFQLYKQKQQELGADISQLKPPHINPAEEIVAFLLAPVVGVNGPLEEMITV